MLEAVHTSLRKVCQWSGRQSSASIGGIVKGPLNPLLFQANTAPQERWDCDILDDEGGRMFLRMVEEKK